MQFMVELGRCPETKIKIFFKLHLQGAEYCPNGTQMPPEGKHVHCGRRDVNTECKKCRKIGNYQQCPVCNNSVEIFSLWDWQIEENDVGEGEIWADKAPWELNCPDKIVIFPELQGQKMGTKRWRENLFNKIIVNLTRGHVILKVNTISEADMVDYLIYQFHDGYIGKVADEMGRNCEVILSEESP